MKKFVPIRLFPSAILIALFLTTALAVHAQESSDDDEGKTVIITAEGLADPNADTYQRDKGLLLDALRTDARRQCIEKAVGIYVESSTLTENYVLIRDSILSKSKGLIKNIIKESDPWLGDDGFMHILLKAEVYVGAVKDSLQQMSKLERVSLIKEYGNPKISVAVTVRDADRASDTEVQRSQIAENIIIEGLTKFGYRVWSEDSTGIGKGRLGQQNASDFAIVGDAKFKKLSAQLTGGTTVTKYVLTSLTIRCTNNHTGEVVPPRTEVPKKKSWADEDGALEEVGRIISGEFSQEFFEDQLMQPSRIYQLQVMGLPDYDAGQLFKKEMLGLRPVLSVDFRSFDAEGMSNYEVEFAGGRENFTETIHTSVIKPLNRKFGERVFKLIAAQGDVARIAFAQQAASGEMLAKFNSMPPASIATASPERIRELVKSEETMKKIAAVNPESVAALVDKGNSFASDAVNAVQDF